MFIFRNSVSFYTYEYFWDYHKCKAILYIPRPIFIYYILNVNIIIIIIVKILRINSSDMYLMDKLYISIKILIYRSEL